jgi:mRNA-degrading endonuclease RelE of RelBE toxin-antitoxin system
MIVEYSKLLEKKVEKMTDKIAINRLLDLVILLKQAKSLSEIPNVRPIKGTQGLYRITTGDYRLIVEPIKNTIIIVLLVDYRRRNEKTYRGLD